MLRLRPRLTLALLAGGAAALAGEARAESVVTVLQGKVAFVAPANPAAGDQLAAHGVAINADVSVSFTIDATAVAGGGADPNYAYYPLAIEELTVTAGSWQVALWLPPGFELLDFVQVGNNVDTGFSPADSYLLTTPGTDTDLVLTGGAPNAFVTLLMVFADGDGSTSNNEGVVQDASKYLVGTLAIAGVNGSVSISLELDGGGGPSIGPGLCQKGQLKAAGTFASKLLKVLGKSAASPPDADPLGEQRAASIAKAEDAFGTGFANAVAKALKKGGTVLLPASEVDTAAESIADDVDALADALLTGANPDDKADRALRGKLFKKAAAQCAKSFAAYAADAVKPDADKLAAKLAAAAETLEAQVSKAIEAAAAQGVDYTGPTGAEIADMVAALASDFDLLTQGLAPAVKAAAAHVQSISGAALPLAR